MKIGILLALPFTLMSLNLQAMDNDVVPGSTGAVNAQNQESLQVVIEQTPYIQDALGKCYDERSANISSCLWTKLEEQGKTNEVKMLIEQAQQARGQAAGELNLSGASQNTVSENAEDDIQKKAIKKLSEIYEQKLAEELKQDGEFLNVTSQDTFFELAKTQISKNIISTWSSVCINAGWDGDNLVIFQPTPNKSLYDEIRRKNIEALTSTRSGVDSDNKPVSSTDNLSSLFFTCAKHLKSLCQEAKSGTIKCPTSDGQTQNETNPNAQGLSTGACKDINMPSYEDGSYFVEPASSPKTITIKPLNKQGSAGTVSADFSSIRSKSKQKACEAFTYVDGLRRQLKATEKVATALEEDNQKRANEKTPDGRSVLRAYQLDKIQRESGNIDIEKVTTVTSADVASEGSYYESIEQDIEKVNKCKMTPNDPQCAGILASSDAEKARIRNTGAALILETAALEKKLESKDSIAAMGAEEKKLLLKTIRPNIDVDEVDLDKTLEEVSVSFLNQRKNLVNSLAERVKEMEKTSDTETEQAAIERIGTSKLSQGNDYIQMIHFNNVISGYFKTDSGQQNTRVLDLELESVANLDNRSLNNATYGNNQNIFNNGYKQTLETGIRDTNNDLQLGASENTQETLRLKADDLSQFIDYELE